MTGPDGLILRLDAGGTLAWLRVAGGRIVQRGTGTDWRMATQVPALAEGERALFLPPPADIALHWIVTPGMTRAQGAAAAAVLALDSSIGPAGALHSAVAPADAPDGAHVVAVAARSAMQQWRAVCAAAGVPEARIVSAPLLLPAPAEGFVVARLGSDLLLRGIDSGLAADEPLAARLIGEAPVRQLDETDLEAALIDALADPPLDMRQGAYAPRHNWLPEAGRLRNVAALAAAIVAVAVFLIPAARIARLYWDAAALDRQSVALARRVAPGVTDAQDAQAQLARLVAQRGASDAAGRLAALASVQRAFPSVRLTSLTQGADGRLRLGVASGNASDIDRYVNRLTTAGWQVVGSVPRNEGGQSLSDVEILP